MELLIKDLREVPELLDVSIEYVSQRWGLNKRIFDECIRSSLTTDNSLPRWYFLLKGNEIIGSYSLMTNDFVSRQDLWPYLSNLYVEENERGKALGARLLEHGRREACKLGFTKVYLCTDHINYYEKYGWTHYTNGYHTWNRESKIYVADTISE